jgi:hypothetical protein
MVKRTQRQLKKLDCFQALIVQVTLLAHGLKSISFFDVDYDSVKGQTTQILSDLRSFKLRNFRLKQY